MPEVCTTCQLMHPPLVECLQAQREAMGQLLLSAARIDTCDCGETIYWLTHLSGRHAPYTSAGLIHFKNCTGKFAQKRDAGVRR